MIIKKFLRMSKKYNDYTYMCRYYMNIKCVI